MLSVNKIRIEYKETPVGLDNPVPRISWQLGAQQRGVLQEAFHIQVSAEDPLFQSTVWDTGRMVSDRSIHVPYDGEALSSCTRYYVRIRAWDRQGNVSAWSETAYWETAFMHHSEWTASWITPSESAMDPQTEAAFLLRNTFTTDKPIRRARIYATALGVYELQLNGTRVSQDRLTPGWTSYAARLQYQTYDVTSMLLAGGNVIGIALANGWYKGHLAWEKKSNIYGDRRAALLQLHVTYEDGETRVFGTDSTWKASTGAVLYSEIYHGETYDARLEKDNDYRYDYDDKDWVSTEVLEQPKDQLVAQENQPTRVVHEIRPVELITTPKGETVIDFGQNMVGWIAFNVTGNPGTTITLTHAEVLDAEGNFYTGNLRAAKQTNTYMCKGGAQEQFEPRFTFQGFRYVKVEGYPGTVDLAKFTGKVVYTDMEPTGTFECSDPLINQLQSNIVWGQRGNFLDVPTDCPQRDERLGWTGDAQVFVRTAAFNMDVASFFTKWLRDLKADQHDDGGVPYVVPNVISGHSSAAWGDAAVICPWVIYESYGDVRVLEEQYDSMKAWIGYIRGQGEQEFLWNTGFHFGDWLGLDAKENSYIGATPTDLIATAFYAYSTNLVRKTAAILGQKEDEAHFGELYDNIVQKFTNEFLTPSHRLAAPTQTAHVLALMFDLVKGPARERTAQTLNRMIEDNKFHLTTGFVGTPYLCPALSANGYHTTAMKLALQTSYPSWLYSVTKGATTIWEHWDGIKEDGSFWSDDMNSYNHYAYGSIGEWLYGVVAGIKTDEEQPGYKRIHIRPQPGEGLTYSKATLESMHGQICSEWRIGQDGKSMTVNVTVPPNTTALIVLPGALQDRVQEGGEKLNACEGITQVGQMGGEVHLEAGSGAYRFEYPLSESMESMETVKS
ncbi:alpha-L-rhamnosidase [Paenibacillus swuensis]|uniref:alpha-L-rhamnosidase n=1 Tax=Paenibacillus swuensis TaxID=1178515 RepID=A0A172TH54_9BACL|nr:alpha-L-rhamnosidase [Paenibacillus swuensis]ANE46371.1 alpha-L-rhamnosidase [Paenibacillus swuensis]